VSSNDDTAYAQLSKRFERLHLLRSATDLLDWDAATMMPTGSAESRGGQMAALRVVATELLQDPRTAQLLDEAEAQPPTEQMARQNLVAMRRAWIHGAALPTDLVEAHAKAVSASEMCWRSARKDSDFKSFAPHLERLIGLTKQIAQAKAAVLGTSEYDALLDEYEPGGRSARLDALFAVLGKELPPLLEAVLDRQAAWSSSREPRGPFPIEKQTRLSKELAERIGFDFERGRIDTSTHPFCGGHSDDVRLTTRYDEADFLSSAMSMLHELGHAMYEQGLPEVWRKQPVGRAPSMAIHESQSLLIEMQASRRPEVVGLLHRTATAIFGDLGCDEAELLRSVRRASRGFIRVDADEVSYPLHVILRYRLERALLSGELAAADLPGAWNEQMQALLGVTPPDDRRGCLQDIHWPTGAFGYFPTYTMGAIAASQLFLAAEKADPQIVADLASGSFTRLFAFLRPNVHRLGASVTVDELLTRVTGQPLDEKVFLRHLHRRYLEDGAS
jgi:carboxypeptidase Taq